MKVDETFICNLKGVEKKRAFHLKKKVLALAEHSSACAPNHLKWQWGTALRRRMANPTQPIPKINNE